MKKSIKLHKCINKEIKVGDKVKIYDGSSLTLNVEDTDKSYYVVYEYPEITGLNMELQNIIGQVVETGIEDKITFREFGEWCYLQDIIVKLGNAQFRTASKMVRIIDSTEYIPEYTIEQLIKKVGHEFKIKK